MGLKNCTADVNVVRDLPDEPSMSAAELKAAFDGAAENVKKWINNVFIPELDEALDKKQGSVSGAASSIMTSDLSAGKVLVSDSSGKIAASEITSAELEKLSGLSANVQTQINEMQSKITTGTASPSGGSDGDIYIQYSQEG